MIPNISVSATSFVSIVMPVRNEGKFIKRSLGAVLNQDYPAEHMEVLVADGLSTDETRDIVGEFQTKYPSLRLIDNPGKIVPTGLNAAIPQARGEIIVRVDGHCEIAPDYVRRCVEHLRNDRVDGVGGPIETIGQTPTANIIALAMSSAFGVGGSAFRTVTNKTMPADTVAFPAYTRTILEKAGPFDEELVRNQDDEYNYRLRKMGAKILLAADVKSRYYSRGSLRSLWRQYFQYGYWKVRVLQKHPLQMRPRQFVPLAFVLALLGSTLLAAIVSWGWWLLMVVGGGYVAANLVASVLVARGSNNQFRRQLPLVFAILHLSYGLGFLVGLIKFWNRWGDKRTNHQALPNPTGDPNLEGSPFG